MAFTSAEKAKIRYYLGYPGLTFRYENPRLESAISVVEGDADVLTIVQGLLTSIEGVFTKIQEVALIGAGVKALDKGDVELYQDNQQTLGMKNIGRTYVNQLSITMGVVIANDVFGTSGYGMETWKATNGVSSLTGRW